MSTIIIISANTVCSVHKISVGKVNKWRCLLENYVFKRKMTSLLAWQAWHHGDSVAPPLKFIDQLDILDSKLGKKGKVQPSRGVSDRTFWNLKFLYS
jgi:hypothetical protein